MSVQTAIDKSENSNAALLAGIHARARQSKLGPPSLLVLISTGASLYGVAVVLKFPLPSIAVSIVAVPGADIASGRRT